MRPTFAAGLVVVTGLTIREAARPGRFCIEAPAMTGGSFTLAGTVTGAPALPSRPHWRYAAPSRSCSGTTAGSAPSGEFRR